MFTFYKQIKYILFTSICQRFQEGFLILFWYDRGTTIEVTMKTDKQQELYAKILDTIYAQRPISRIDISKLTHITPATVGAITKELLAQGWIHEIGELTDHSVGRKKILLDASANAFYFAGIELSEKHFYLVITDNLGTIYAKHNQQVDPSISSYYKADYISELIQAFLKQHKHYSVQAIGIALPGHYDHSISSSTHINTNNPIWQQVDLTAIAKSFPIPVVFSNNAHCMIIAKRLYEQQAHNHNFIFFHVGRGMHCSYMYKGVIYSRHNAVVGEIGHTIINPAGELCECGKKGCLQTYASNAWLLKKAKLLHQYAPHSHLRSLVDKACELKLDHLLIAYELGDVGVTTLIHTAIDYLVLSLSNLSLLIDTEQIYLHGRFISHPLISSKILQALQNDIKLLSNQKKPEIIVMPFSVYNAAVGATGLCIDELYLNYKNKYD